MIRNLKLCVASSMLGCLGLASFAQAADYEVDPAHSFVQFRVQHLGYSWLIGRFNSVKGEFSYDEGDPAKSRINVLIDTGSVDTNHVKRDQHLRSEDFLNTGKHLNATFRSTSFQGDANGGTLTGDLKLLGVTKPVTIEIQKIGEGDDPWGGYRAGFEGTTRLIRADFGDTYDLGPASESMDIELFIEGIRSK